MKKLYDLLTVTFFCAIVGIFSVAFLIIPDRDFSEQENRHLQQAPSFSKESFFSGEFAEKINLYFSDQFPLRDAFVKLKGASELALLKGENNGVLYSYDQLAVKDFDFYISAIEIAKDTDRIDNSVIESRLTGVNRLSETLDVPLVTVIPPRTVDIADSKFGYDRPDGDAVFELMNDTFSEKSGFINTLS
ncbi:MAG: hypothetical protein IKT34_03310, partial [Clostridia bacterium]|nr:hypothetical protein [Clostridia bacterium]